MRDPPRPRSPTSSSAPASPGSAWRSSSTRPARPTSSSSRRTPTSAAPGAPTPTPAPPATCPASSTPSPSRPTPTGRGPSRRSPRSTPTCAGWPGSPACSTASPSTPRSRRRRYDEQAQRWRVRTSRGEVTATTLITGSGGLSEPRLPEIDGIERFQGELFHSARWDHDVDLDRQAGRRHRHRRLEHPARPRGREGGRPRRRLPAHRAVGHPAQRPALHPPRAAAASGTSRLVQRAYRTATYWGRESYVPAFTWQPRLAAPARRAALLNIARGIPDPDAAREGHPRLRDRLQAHPDQQHLLPRARPRQRRRSSPTRSPRSPATRSSPPTASSARST